MLDYKISYLLDNRSSYSTTIIERLNNTLAIYGKADFTALMYIDMLYSLLATDFLGEVQKLELYKRLMEVLRKLGVNVRVPEFEPISDSDYVTIFSGVGIPGLPDDDIDALKQSSVKITEDITIRYTTLDNVMYFAYPVAFPNAIIVDENGFTVTNGWTYKSGTLSVDGVYKEYKIYESKTISALTSYGITFKI